MELVLQEDGGVSALGVHIWLMSNGRRSNEDTKQKKDGLHKKGNW